MADQRLVNYIKSEFSRGISLEQIKQNLISQGWSDYDINEATNMIVPKRETSRAETTAKIVKREGTIFSVYYLIKTIVGVIFVIGLISILMLIGLPWYFGVPIIIFTVFIVILQIIRIKRISSARI